MMTTTPEMNFCRNILLSLMSSSYSIITSPFMNSIDSNNPNFKDYYKVIKEPICLNQMKAKMDMLEYQDIKEFVCDFRLMLFNCYRFFGCDSKMGKIATKLESMFEQKLILLPIDIRVKTSLDAILMDDTQTEIIESGMSRRRSADRTFVTPIKTMMDEMEKHGTIGSMFTDNTEFQHDPINFLIEKLRKWEDKRRNQQFIRTFDEWFASNASESDCRVLDSCAEFIELVQFISAAFQGLGLDMMLEERLKMSHITIENLEYAILFPRTSRLLCGLVPLITTSSKNRQFVIKNGLVEYDDWNKEVSERITFLYKIWNERRMCDTPDLFVRRYSVDPVIFKVLGHRRPVTDKKQFHELTVFQRCHTLLALSCLALRLQDSIHFGMDKSIEWESHKVIVLAQVGKYEYVRFGGLGQFASYFVYRIGNRVVDDDLAQYNVTVATSKCDKKAPKKEKLPDKYRLPDWYKMEMKKSKSKKSAVPPACSSSSCKAASKPAKPAEVTPRRQSTRATRGRQSAAAAASSTLSISSSANSNNDNSNTVDTVMVTNCPDEVSDCKPIDCAATSVLTNENEVTFNEDKCTVDGDKVCETLQQKKYNDGDNEEEDKKVDEDNEDEDDDEDEMPEIEGPPQDDFLLIVRDLATVTKFIGQTNQIIESGDCTGDELQGYQTLLEKLDELQVFYELNEADRKENCNQSRLMLRQEIESHASKNNKVRNNEYVARPAPVPAVPAAPPSVSKQSTNESDSEYNPSESSGDRYTESELMSFVKPRIGRAERLERRLKRKMSDGETNSPKRSRFDNAPTAPNGRPTHVLDQLPPVLPQQVKKKVYRICDDYFTEDLEPVKINEDGTMVHLSRDLIKPDQYELARKMIAMYKLKTAGLMPSSGQNGTRSLLSSS